MSLVDLYHRTSPGLADRIYAELRFISHENSSEAYFSDRPDGMIVGYGDAVVHIRVPEALAELEDEFPDGEQHFSRADFVNPTAALRHTGGSDRGGHSR